MNNSITNFPVGFLSEFNTDVMRDEDILDFLFLHPCFNKLTSEYKTELRQQFPVFERRLNVAVDSIGNEAIWVTLCDEPKRNLRRFWKVDKSRRPLSPSDRKEHTVMKNQSQSIYYCIYVILLWRHQNGFDRYKMQIKSMDDFRSLYEYDLKFEKKNLDALDIGGNTRLDKWDNLFKYRNVLILAAAVKPTKRNKGIFSKISSILAEGRIHSTGGGQSFSSDRRGRIYEIEGSSFAHGDFFSSLSESIEDDDNSDNELLFDECIQQKRIAPENTSDFTYSMHVNKKYIKPNGHTYPSLIHVLDISSNPSMNGSILMEPTIPNSYANSHICNLEFSEPMGYTSNESNLFAYFSEEEETYNMQACNPYPNTYMMQPYVPERDVVVSNIIRTASDATWIHHFCDVIKTQNDENGLEMEQSYCAMGGY